MIGASDKQMMVHQFYDTEHQGSQSPIVLKNKISSAQQNSHFRRKTTKVPDKKFNVEGNIKIKDERKRKPNRFAKLANLNSSTDFATADLSSIEGPSGRTMLSALNPRPKMVPNPKAHKKSKHKLASSNENPMRATSPFKLITEPSGLNICGSREILSPESRKHHPVTIISASENENSKSGQNSFERRSSSADGAGTKAYEYDVKANTKDHTTNVVIKPTVEGRNFRISKGPKLVRSQSPSHFMHSNTRSKTKSPAVYLEKLARRGSKETVKVTRDGKVKCGERKFTVYRPHDDPAFFNIFIEKKHADHLARKDLDDESRLHVIYHVLKE